MTSSYKISFTKHSCKPVELREILTYPDALERQAVDMMPEMMEDIWQ